mgnify:CR=1 FL=1
MKSLRQTFRDNRRKAGNAVRSWLQPRLGAVGRRYRVAARIRKANSWAKRHPRRTFGYVVCSLLLILAFDIIITGARMESQEPNLQSIVKVEPVFNGFRTIQRGKEDQRRRIAEMAGDGQALKHELDSLIAITDKSHDDSIAIIQRYRQLEQIVKSLKNTDKNEED